MALSIPNSFKKTSVLSGKQRAIIDILAFLSGRFHYYSDTMFAVHFYDCRFFQSDMPQIRGLIDSWERI